MKPKIINMSLEDYFCKPDPKREKLLCELNHTIALLETIPGCTEQVLQLGKLFTLIAKNKEINND